MGDVTQFPRREHSLIAGPIRCQTDAKDLTDNLMYLRERVPLDKRHNLPVICDQEFWGSTIFWVALYKSDHYYLRIQTSPEPKLKND
jgi:hypothetical protein